MYLNILLQTSYTLMWCLYCLGTNPEAQEKLRSEVQQVVGDSEMVTPEHVGRMPYLRHVVKETQRYRELQFSFTATF